MGDTPGIVVAALLSIVLYVAIKNGAFQNMNKNANLDKASAFVAGAILSSVLGMVFTPVSAAIIVFIAGAAYVSITKSPIK